MSKRRFFNVMPLLVVATMSLSGVAHAQEAQFVQVDARRGEAEPADNRGVEQADDRGVDARHGRGEAEPADDRGVDARRGRGEAEAADDRGADG